MNAVERFARLLKPPKEQIGTVIGVVIQTAPLRVRINEYIVAQPPRLFYIAGLVFYPGDRVIVTASVDNQQFFVIGKAATA